MSRRQAWADRERKKKPETVMCSFRCPVDTLNSLRSLYRERLKENRRLSFTAFLIDVIEKGIK